MDSSRFTPQHINVQLLNAVKKNNLTLVKKLILSGASPISCVDDKGYFALMVAVELGNINIVKALIKKKPITMVGAINKNNHTALMVAAEQGFTEIIKILIKHLPCPHRTKVCHFSIKNNDGFDSISLAAKNGHLETMQLLLEKYNKSHYKIVDPHLEIYNLRDSNTPLMCAIQHSRYEIIVELVNTYNFEIAHINQLVCFDRKDAEVKEFIRTAIGVFAKKRDIECLKYVIELYNNKHNRVLQADTIDQVLNMAAIKGVVSIVDMFESNYSNLNNLTLLAYDHNHSELLMKLIEKGGCLTAYNLASPVIYKVINFLIRKYEIQEKSINFVESCLLHKLENGSSKDQAYFCFKQAAIFNYSSVVKYCLEGFPEFLNVQDNNEQKSALMLASENDSINVVKTLIKYEAFIDLSDYRCKDQTALILAIKGENPEVAITLIKAGASISKKDTLYKTPLMYASEIGLSSVVKEIIKHPPVREMIHEKCAKGYNALMYAIINGHPEIIQDLITVYPTLHKDTPFIFDYDAIWMRGEYQELGAVTYLETKEKSAFELSDYLERKDIRLAFELAVNSGVASNLMNSNIDVPELVKSFVEIVLKSQIDYQRADGFTYLLLAAYYGNLKTFDALISCGASIDICLPCGATVLHEAAGHGHEIMVSKIIKLAPWLIDKLNHRQESPLLFAVLHGRSKIVDILLGEGKSALLDQKYNGEHLLNIGALNGHIEVSKVLIRCGANINAQNDSGSTPFLSAISASQFAMVDFLIRAGADINFTESLEFLKTKSDEKFMPQSLLPSSQIKDLEDILFRILSIMPLSDVRKLKETDSLNSFMVIPDFLNMIDQFIVELTKHQQKLLSILGSLLPDDACKPSPYLELPLEVRALILSYLDYPRWLEHRIDFDLGVALNSVIEMRQNRLKPPLLFLGKRKAENSLETQERQSKKCKNLDISNQVVLSDSESDSEMDLNPIKSIPRPSR